MGSSVLASAATESGPAVSLFVIAACAVLAPLVARSSRGLVPATVVLIGLGVIVGPEVLGWAHADGLSMVRDLGMGFLFLLAGYEVDTTALRGRQGRFAWLAWLVSFVVATTIAMALLPGGFGTAAALGLAVTSTALGALVPILRDRGLLTSPLGRSVMVHGAVGELGPVIAMAVLFNSDSVSIGVSIASAVGILGVFTLVAIVAAVVPGRVLRRAPDVYHHIVGASSGTTQMGMRLVVLLLTGLMAVASALQIDVVLGAFAAGLVLRRLVPEGDHGPEERIDTIAYSLFIPVFFVMSGMALSISAVAEAPEIMLGALAGILLLRGGGVFLVERFAPTGSGLDTREDTQVALYAASGLPIIVAVTELAVSNELMTHEVAANLVAAGSVSLLVFPYLAARWRARTAAPQTSGSPG